MNDYVVSVLLGIVEGLTEFLPVSSTAHLRITEALLHVSLTDPYWKMYTIVIQLGAILALMLLFIGRIVAFLRTFPKGEQGDRTVLTHPLSLVMVAFVCTAAPAFLLQKVIGKHLESLVVIEMSLLIGGIVMWAVDAWSSRQESSTKDVDHMGLGQAIWIGLCQVLSAVFPGTSRSMSTISAGQLAGMTRNAALEFSFLVSIPVMVASTGFEFLKTVHPSKKALAQAAAQGDPIAPLVMTGHGWVVLLIGFVVSFIVAFFVVEWFLQYVRKHGFTIFAIYRIVLAVVLIAFGAHLFHA
ncbi:undecaprenyl-diphosphate phosphatase [Acidipila sp. EB88]|uniref:undecaprenyl-diphosphate phosphatase n=1 Tax=Acidipila sp. EB88 TaxID=2305226 RepID=UPI000F5F5C86|nr:undecaprenyl-diphosphate phosphatase [Acidipila sp. EB88]RRA48793.1 undecaprenyl-diphosphate phosphatase [Acidipila sp. EB88]